ncbi:MAG: hypothetical protein AAF611_22965 [Bacteroidota bacterium]
MKKKSLPLTFKKTKIVNLTMLSKLHGGTENPIQTDMHDPEASCGDCTTHDTGTNDKTNTNNGVPTLGGTMSIIIGVTFTCSS